MKHFKVITSTSKRGQSIISAYCSSNMRNLWGAYSSYSDKKADAWDYCKQLTSNLNGYGLKVIGYNTRSFSAGFLFDDEEGNQILMYITKDNHYAIPL